MTENIQVVARQPEFERLDNHLTQALNGNGQICFISGEAGAGKSVLAAAFARQAQERYKNLIIASGLCDPQIGEASPYAPFRDVLSELFGIGSSQRVQKSMEMSKQGNRLGKGLAFVTETLIEYGPDLVGVFIPGAALGVVLSKFLLNKA
jgi:predicted ATPase